MPPPRALRVLEPANDEPESAEVADTMRAYANAHHVDELLHVLLAELLEKQPLDPFEHLITALTSAHPALDALEEHARTQRFDLRREKTKRALVVTLFRRLLALQQRNGDLTGDGASKLTLAQEGGGASLARSFLTKQLRLRETKTNLQALFPTHARDLAHYFLVHEAELPPELTLADFSARCMTVLATMATPRRQEQRGPLDWLVPFIPPFLRVNRDTRTALEAFVRSLSVVSLATQLVNWLRANGASAARVALLATLWVAGLVWTESDVPEFSGAYVTLSGLGALAMHVMSGDRTAPTDGLSAYSVFNKGGARMLGSLSAEQFENEIRHRQPGYGEHDEADDNVDGRPAGHDADASESDEDANDPEMLLAMQLSLQEKKREDRRARRSTKRR
ncbi:hypothetical protein PybrP1_003850 [[Pythium] brassicae (nom. inval.)]|nr:hypothetical protein PybrP1_003850 [[Pythium] brassicae (nom. inval.)]